MAHIVLQVHFWQDGFVMDGGGETKLDEQDGMFCVVMFPLIVKNRAFRYYVFVGGWLL